MSKTVTAGMLTESVDGIKINTDYPCNASNYAKLSSRSVAYVVMHYTGNTKDVAINNAKYYRNTANLNASAHFFVDDNTIYQSVALHDSAWHCGTSGTYYHSACRNANSIGIEMCCTAGNYKISKATKEHGAQLCAYVCKLLGISSAEVDTYVLRHYDVTHKLCPAQMAGTDNAEWEAFKARVKAILDGATAVPSAPDTAAANLKEDDIMTGEQIYNALREYLETHTLGDSQQAELSEAVDMGITDGSEPTQLIQRYQAAIMAKRAVEAALAAKEG